MRETDPVRAAAALPYRLVEPRLSGGWGYKPLRPARSEIHDSSAAMRRLRGAAAGMINDGNGVGYLMAGDAKGAIDALKRAQSGPHNADTSNDLAGALLVRADELDDGSLAADALAAVDDALSIDSRSAPALFNRGLAFERLGLRFEARRAWSRYLEVDPASRWSDEALHRLGVLGASDDTGEWERGSAQAQRLSPHMAAEQLGRLARQYPQQARLWAEGIAMNNWAVAILNSDTAAARWLQMAERVGTVLREASGESLAIDAVTVAGDAAARGQGTPLATAYVTYWAGRAAHHENHPVEAELNFRQAAAMFEAAGSPMMYVARYYVGSALHAQLKLVEAAAVLDGLAAEHLDTRRYLAIDATLGWERGACFMERGAISASIDVFTHSRDEFLLLGDTDLAAVMDAYLASAFDYLGDETSAWRERCRSFEALSRSGNRYRLLVIVQSAAAAAIRSGKWSRAAALLMVSTAEAERQKKAIIASEGFTLFARVEVERGNLRAATLHIKSARAWTGKLEDPSVRARAEATMAYVDGLTLRQRDASAASARFTDALHFFEHADRRIEVPRIYLERASIKESSGDIAGARQDLDAGIDAFELERRQVRDLNQRATLLTSFDVLFEKAFDLAMKVGDHPAAFALTERYRARALTEMFSLNANVADAEGSPLSLSAIRAALAPDAAIIEYSVLPDRLVAFVVRRGSFSTVMTPISAGRVAELAKAFQQTSEEGEGAIAAASAADSVLMQPIRYALAGATHIAVIPDRHISNVPYAALYDSVTGRFLIENAAITIAPSATLALNASRRAGRSTTKHSSILAIAGSVFDSQRYPGAAPLDQVKREASTVASFYTTAHVLAGEDATPAAVIKALPQYDFVHFAAHGVPTIPTADSALLLAPSNADHGTLRVRDIAALTLHGIRVVVLAACGSAAPVPISDGATNLSLAFLAAGVPVTVASLTDIEDRASAPLMEALHRRISEGGDAAESVRAVTLSKLRDSNNQIVLPLKWSSIVVVGGSGDLVVRERKGTS
jgi:CHAT domain-containing protein